MATRDAVGKALVELGKENKDVVVLDADLCESTKTVEFKKEFPTRFFDCGIAECNMIGVAAGLSSVGKIPFAASFSVFVALRALEQIRNSVCYTNLNVKIIGSHSGFSAAQDGATHQAVEDVAVLRAVPNIKIVIPCDFVETVAAIKKAADEKGPIYLRTSKFEVESINGLEYLNEFEIGKAVVLKKGFFVCLFATGVMVNFSLQAARLLEADGFSTMVVNVHTIKPLDERLILDVSKNAKFLFTVEEHSTIGGLGEAVCSFLSEKNPRRVVKIGIEDKFGESGKTEDILKKHKLLASSIYERIKIVVSERMV